MSAVLGYRSSLSQVFIHRDLDLTNNAIMEALIKKFRKYVPKRSTPIPYLNVNMILGRLVSADFELINEISIEKLTWKTIFLTALASV